MPFYKIILWKHKFSGQTIFCERKDLWIELNFHISFEHILDVVLNYNIVENPRFQNKFVVINRLIDFMHESTIQEKKQNSGEQLDELLFSDDEPEVLDVALDLVDEGIVN